MRKIEDFMTVEKKKKKMGFEESTIIKWCREKRFDSYKVGKQIIILEVDVVGFVDSGKACF